MNHTEMKRIIDENKSAWDKITMPEAMAIIQEQIKEIQERIDQHAQILNDVRGLDKPEPWQ